MAEQKKRVATKKAIAEYRAAYPDVTDEALISIIDSKGTHKYEYKEEIVAVLVKELFKAEKDLTIEDVTSLFVEKDKVGDLRKFYEGERARMEKVRKVNEQINEIKDSSEKSGHYTNIIESLFPDKYEDKLNIFDLCARNILNADNGILTDETFTEELKRLDNDGSIKFHTKEAKKRSELSQRQSVLIDKIYKDASRETRYLSQYPEFDDELRAYFEKEVYPDRDLTLAQKFYKLFCNYQFTGYPPFHSYSEPNGDIIFTKQRRTAADYDSNGKPIGNSGSSGCMGVVLMVIAAIGLLSLIL